MHHCVRRNAPLFCRDLSLTSAPVDSTRLPQGMRQAFDCTSILSKWNLQFGSVQARSESPGGKVSISAALPKHCLLTENHAYLSKLPQRWVAGALLNVKLSCPNFWHRPMYQVGSRAKPSTRLTNRAPSSLLILSR